MGGKGMTQYLRRNRFIDLCALQCARLFARTAHTDDGGASYHCGDLSSAPAKEKHTANPMIYRHADTCAPRHWANKPRRNLARRQYHRQAFGRFRFHHFFQPRHINIQYFPIQKQQDCFRLPLRGCSYISLNCKMRQKYFYFRHSHLFRMPFAMKQNKAPRPINVGILGANGIVSGAYTLAHPIQ